MSDKTITIVAKKDGWRRCGTAHPATPTQHAADAFTKEEWDRIKADPMLIVYGEGQAPAAPAADVTALRKQVEDLTAENAALKKRVADLEEQRADKTGSSPDAGGGGGNAKAAGAPSGRKGGGK